MVEVWSSKTFCQAGGKRARYTQAQKVWYARFEETKAKKIWEATKLLLSFKDFSLLQRILPEVL